MTNQLPIVRFKRGWIEMQLDGTWQASGPDTEPFAKIATLMSQPPLYVYSPSHGSYGARIATKVAKAFQAKLVLPKVPTDEKPPEGIVF